MPQSRDERERLLNIAMLQKVLYELDYELNNRPDWVSIPLRGLLDLFGVRPTPAIGSTRNLRGRLRGLGAAQVTLCAPRHERRSHIGAVSSSRSRLRAPERLSRLRPTDARSAVVTLLFDVALVAITVVVKVVLLNAMDADAGFTIYVPAVAIAAWYRGLLGGILATVLSALFDTLVFVSGAVHLPGRCPRPAGSPLGVHRRWRGGLVPVASASS